MISIFNSITLNEKLKFFFIKLIFTNFSSTLNKKNKILLVIKPRERDNTFNSLTKFQRTIINNNNSN